MGFLATVYVILAGYDYFLSYSGADVVGINSCNLFGLQCMIDPL